MSRKEGCINGKLWPIMAVTSGVGGELCCAVDKGVL